MPVARMLLKRKATPDVRGLVRARRRLRLGSRALGTSCAPPRGVRWAARRKPSDDALLARSPPRPQNGKTPLQLTTSEDMRDLLRSYDPGAPRARR